MKAKLSSTLDKIEHLAITTDLWTSLASKSFITITCHFVDEAFILRSAVLSTNILLDESNHSAQNITDTVRLVLDKWNIYHKISAVVTDNDKTMIKMCQIIQKRHLPCFAHTLNLIVQEALKLDCIQPVVVKCKRIVTFFKNSNIAYAKFRNAQQPGKVYSLKQEVPTRWNSAFSKIQRIILTNDSIAKVLLGTPKAPAPLTADEVAILNDIVKLLSPFDNATVKTSSSTSVTVSLIIPIVCGLLDTMDGLKLKLETKEGFNMLAILTDCIKRRLLEYERCTVTRFGTLLDPRFKKKGFLSPQNLSEATKLLENDITLLNKNVHPANENTEPPTPTESPGHNQPLIQFLRRNIAEKIRTDRVDSILSLRNYYDSPNLHEDCNPLEYWHVSN
ncbi:PREDICTED: zinc finger BED domain-containing protein 1-like [Rhagoletis zephyria]|uniref:zinc finger BED domain-containing protein 1-like n=1 Tax=Rhagoletis zephyria TaxID=28612 RepID=UPI0008113FB0|nr:PREDICTED: zinc finger BED domain-containing protein 1-like [Rhagoletis zephyria]